MHKAVWTKSRQLIRKDLIERGCDGICPAGGASCTRLVLLRYSPSTLATTCGLSPLISGNVTNRGDHFQLSVPPPPSSQSYLAIGDRHHRHSLTRIHRAHLPRGNVTNRGDHFQLSVPPPPSSQSYLGIHRAHLPRGNVTNRGDHFQLSVPPPPSSQSYLFTTHATMGTESLPAIGAPIVTVLLGFTEHACGLSPLISGNVTNRGDHFQLSVPPPPSSQSYLGIHQHTCHGEM
ncbi:hypothetical protein J6590_011251 [Homalodisca vitripennis]|nr:hypothetical protein J6590_011251 [Homalodisca vitripennis]